VKFGELKVDLDTMLTLDKKEEVIVDGTSMPVAGYSGAVFLKTETESEFGINAAMLRFGRFYSLVFVRPETKVIRKKKRTVLEIFFPLQQMQQTIAA